MGNKTIAESFYGIVGHPVKHSVSPAMQNAAFKACAVDAEYVKIDVPPDRFDETIEGIKISGFKGFNVTVPYKQKIFKHLDDVEDQARLSHSVNTVRVEGDGRFVGTSTDGPGLLRALNEEEILCRGKKILLVGAGGAANAVAFSLAREKNVELLVTNRTEESGRALVRRLKKFCAARFVKLRETLLDSLDTPLDLLVNCTSVGLNPRDRFLFDLSGVGDIPIVVDLIYNPPRTHLLAAAEKAGCRTVNGLGMLLHQGALAFEFWTGQTAPMLEMEEALVSFFGRPIRSGKSVLED